MKSSQSKKGLMILLCNKVNDVTAQNNLLHCWMNDVKSSIRIYNNAVAWIFTVISLSSRRYDIIFESWNISAWDVSYTYVKQTYQEEGIL